MRLIRDLSIRYKLMFMLVSVVSVVLLLSFAFIVRRDIKNTESQMVNEYTALAKMIAADGPRAIELLPTEVDFLDTTTAMIVVSKLRVDESIIFAALYDDTGKAVAQYEGPQYARNEITLPAIDQARFSDEGFLEIVEAFGLADGEKPGATGKVYLRVSSKRLADGIRSHLNIAIAVYAVALLMTFLLSFVLQHFISKPILELASAARRVSTEHDYSIRGQKEANDELGVLCDGFNSMLDQIQRKESELAQSNSELDNTVREQQTMLDQLQQREAELKTANADLDRTIQGVRDAVVQLASMSEELAATVAQQTTGAREQAASINETVSAVDEITETSDQASAQAKKSRDAAERTMEVGDAGQKSVADSIMAMETVSQHVEITADHMNSLAQKILAISEILETMTDIAEQTNILALNAAVEASRAGEHGKGFSVVASEVKQLATQSKKAAEHILKIIREIQEATNTTVLSTEKGAKSVEHARSVVTQAGKTIDALTKALAETSQAATQIMASANQQAQGMVRVNSAMNQINSATQQQLAGARQTEQTAKNLSQLSHRLTELITGHDVVNL